MNQAAIDKAAALFVAARHGGALIDRLPPECRPGMPRDALAIQDATVRLLGERVAAWKVAAPIDGVLMRGAILQSRIFQSPATVPARLVPMLGVEAEIAFRFEDGLAPRDREYTYEEVAAGATALAAIEIVDTRFASYQDTPLLDRSADCVSNGGLVCAAPRRDWRGFDLRNIEVTLFVEGAVVVRRAGGHAAGDPLLPAIALANDLRGGEGIVPGTVVTTGTYTGLTMALPGQSVVARFAAFGGAEVRFASEGNRS
jgi:2-keto-4-pentenoate hydratase